MAAVGLGGRSSNQADAGAATYESLLVPPNGLHAEAVPPLPTHKHTPTPSPHPLHPT